MVPSWPENFSNILEKNHLSWNQNRIKTLSHKGSYTYYLILKLRLMDYGQNVPNSIAAPRFHTHATEEKFISAEKNNCDLCCVTNAEESLLVTHSILSVIKDWKIDMPGYQIQY